MSGEPEDDLQVKISRLVEERGWNQEDFARISRLNRHTIRQIMTTSEPRKLRNATVSKCAEALSLTVNELRTQPLSRLLPRMHGKPAIDGDIIETLYERARMQDLVSWVERNKERASRLSPWEMEELLAMQGPEGALAKFGVEHVVDLIERKRQMIDRIQAIASTEYLPLLEQLIELMHARVRPRG